MIIYWIEAQRSTYIAALRGSCECHCSDAISSGDVDRVLQSISTGWFNSWTATKLICKLDGNNYSHKYQLDMHHSFESGIVNKVLKGLIVKFEENQNISLPIAHPRYFILDLQVCCRMVDKLRMSENIHWLWR